MSSFGFNAGENFIIWISKQPKISSYEFYSVKYCVRLVAKVIKKVDSLLIEKVMENYS